MKVLLTGGAGFIGSHMSSFLAQEKHQVRAIDSFTPYYERRLKERNVALVGGWQNYSFEERTVGSLRAEDLRGIDVVVHLAAQPGVRASWDDFDTYLHLNLAETNSLFEAATTAGVKRFVFASSSSVYGNAASYPTSERTPPAPRSPYGVTKLAGESLLAAHVSSSDMEVVALRFFTVYGPGQRPDMAIERLVRAGLGMSAERFQLFGDGLQRRDFTYVDDVVRACALAMEKPAPSKFVILNVGGSGDTGMLELVDIVSEHAGAKIPMDLQPEQRGDVFRTGADPTQAKAWLGWTPQVCIEEGVARQVEFVRTPKRELWTTLSANFGL